jgi:hypothetical protein
MDFPPEKKNTEATLAAIGPAPSVRCKFVIDLPLVCAKRTSPGQII